MPTGSMRPWVATTPSAPSSGGTSAPSGPVLSVTRQILFVQPGPVRCGQPAHLWTNQWRLWTTSDVQEAHVFGVALDETAARFDVLAHQYAEQLVRGGGVVECHLLERAGRRVHRGLPQLRVVHLAQTLEPLNVVRLGVRLGLLTDRDQAVALPVGVRVLGVVAALVPFDLV